MNKKRFIGLVALVVCVAASSFGSRKNEVTLVMVPREDVAKQVGKDLATLYRTLLISYQLGADGAVSLHGWTGTEWVNVTPEKFKDGSFFRTGPDSALIIEKDGAPIPESLVPPEAWCGAVYKVTTSDSRPMIHLVGQYFDFKFKTWELFSSNYNLPMEGINPENLNVAWYHKRLSENLKKDGQSGANDLQYWVAVRHPEAVVEALAAEETPVAEEPAAEAPATEEGEEQPDMEMPEDPEVNPFTNTAPEAVVLGPGQVNAAKVEEE